MCVRYGGIGVYGWKYTHFPAEDILLRDDYFKRWKNEKKVKRFAKFIEEIEQEIEPKISK